MFCQNIKYQLTSHQDFMNFYMKEEIDIKNLCSKN